MKVVVAKPPEWAVPCFELVPEGNVLVRGPAHHNGLRWRIEMMTSHEKAPNLWRKLVMSAVRTAPPLSEQHRIVSAVTEQKAAADRVRQFLEDQLEAINKLPAAFLHQAVNGEL